VPFGRRADDCETEPGPGPVGAATPEALECELRLLEPQPLALVRDAEPNNAVRLVDGDGDASPGRPVNVGVLHEVAERALKRCGVALDRDGL
jgi:hypothetical protein